MGDEDFFVVAGHPVLNSRCTRLPGCIRLWNDLNCVRWGIKLYSPVSCLCNNLPPGGAVSAHARARPPARSRRASGLGVGSVHVLRTLVQPCRRRLPRSARSDIPTSRSRRVRESRPRRQRQVLQCFCLPWHRWRCIVTVTAIGWLIDWLVGWLMIDWLIDWLIGV